MQTYRYLSTEDKTLIKGLVESVYSIKYINMDVIYQDIENILGNMSKDAINDAIEKYNDDDEDHYNNLISKIRRIVLLEMFIEKDLSEMEWEIDNKIIAWLKRWNNQ